MYSLVSRSRLCGFALTALLFSSLAGAIPITIDPDDYAVGTDLSNGYVTLRSTFNGGSSPVTARESSTGGNSFGWFAGGLGRSGCCGEPGLGGPAGADVHNYIGFGMYFHQEVDQVSLTAINWYPPGLSAVWYAFDESGDLIGNGMTDFGNYGEPFLIDIELDGIWSMIVGGFSLISAIEFDNLTFNTATPPVPVSEPGMMALLALALLTLRRPRRHG
jgi:MYXO-CTERM domain-containing protein